MFGVFTHLTIEKFPLIFLSDFSSADTRILIMTTRACGLGLNLSAADTVIFVEPDWNPFVDLQAMDRVHRIGQTKPVTVYRLVADETIEERIIGVQELKEQVFREVINSGNDGSEIFDPVENACENNSVHRSSKGLGATLWNSLVMSYGSSGSTVSRDSTGDDDHEYDCLDLEGFLKQASSYTAV
jgi:Helicase conserved C-terminal domain